MDKQEALRMLPAVHKVLASPEMEALTVQYPLRVASDVVAQVLQALRDRWNDAPVPSEVWCEMCSMPAIVKEVERRLLRRFQPALQPVLNLTGIIIHTNLGRAPLSERAIQAVVDVAKGYSNLEYRLDTGSRGSRHTHIEDRICRLTGAEGALVVNNNAAAVFLVLSELGKDGEAIVSRGQLVEIGGSFRIPDIMKTSGVRLVEVGTTNKTRLCDYEEAIHDTTKLLMRVHTSNFRIVGFTEQPDLKEMVDLAHAHNLPMVDDLGSGALFDFASRGIGDDPVVRRSIEADVDVITFSGDKLLGGAQAGIIIGKKKWIERLKKHPLTRALRVDKMTLAALEATLVDHEDDHLAQEHVPVVRMLTETLEVVRQRAERVMQHLENQSNVAEFLAVEMVEVSSLIGGGALPTEALPSIAIQITPSTVSTQMLIEDLRQIPRIPVVGRIVNDAVILDVRTLLPDQEELLALAIAEVVQSYAGNR